MYTMIISVILALLYNSSRHNIDNEVDQPATIVVNILTIYCHGYNTSCISYVINVPVWLSWIRRQTHKQ